LSRLHRANAPDNLSRLHRVSDPKERRAKVPRNTGEEILAYCTACKMDLIAVIVAMTKGKIAKVQCKTCKKDHGYKDPKGAKEPKAPLKQASSSALESRVTSIESEWKRLISEATKIPPMTYSPKTLFPLGVIVKHPTFGDGVVIRLHYPNKAEVIFREDIKLLIHGRT